MAPIGIGLAGGAEVCGERGTVRLGIELAEVADGDTEREVSCCDPFIT